MPSAARLLPAFACAATLALAGSTAATATNAAFTVGGGLDVSSDIFRGKAFTTVRLTAWAEEGARLAPNANVRLLVPRGYILDLGRAPSAEAGYAVAYLDDGRRDAGVLSGPLIAEDPGASLQDPAAQACAPGRHSAVWSLEETIEGERVRLLVLVDAVDGGAAGYALQVCPLWPASTAHVEGLTSHAMLLRLDGVEAPTAPGVYTWSALVTPADATLAAQPERAFELRAVHPLPHTLTLSARHDPKTRSVVLSGRLTAAGKPSAGVEVLVTAFTGTYDFTAYGAVRTNGNGSFSLRRAIDRTTVFTASADVPPRDCTAPATAPGGCVRETVSAPTQPVSALRIPRATDPRRAIRKSDTALARRAGLRRADFPSDWEAEMQSPFAVCEGFRPDLSDLTLTGEASSAYFYGDEGGAGSRAAVFRSDAQARAAFGRVARLEVARCIARDLRDADFSVLQVQAIDYPGLGKDARAFRVVADRDQEILYVDVVYLLRGRVLVELIVGSFTQPLLSEEALAAKLAARASGG